MINKNRLLLIAGNLGTIMIIIGALFTINHYPFQKELLIVGSTLFAIFYVWVVVEIFRLNQSLIYRAIWIFVVLVVPVLGSWIFYYNQLKRKRILQKKD